MWLKQPGRPRRVDLHVTVPPCGDVRNFRTECAFWNPCAVIVLSAKHSRHVPRVTSRMASIVLVGLAVDYAKLYRQSERENVCPIFYCAPRASAGYAIFHTDWQKSAAACVFPASWTRSTYYCPPHSADALLRIHDAYCQCSKSRPQHLRIHLIPLLVHLLDAGCRIL